MAKVNILPLVDYPQKLAPIIVADYTEFPFENLKEFAYRIGNNLYIFGRQIKNYNPSNYKEISFATNQAIFSLLLRRLILYSIAETIEQHYFCIPNNVKNTSKLIIQRKEPSLEINSVQVYERLELQTIHWQDKNFGIIINYKSVNEWAPTFRQKVGNKPCSYQNIRKYLPLMEASELLRDKIPALRRERAYRAWRGDALKQKFERTLQLFKKSINWPEGENIVDIRLPTEQTVKISDEFVDIIPLGENHGILF